MEKQLKTILIGQFNHENYVTTLSFVMNKPGNTELLSGLVITQKLIENNEVKNYNMVFIDEYNLDTTIDCIVESINLLDNE